MDRFIFVNSFSLGNWNDIIAKYLNQSVEMMKMKDQFSTFWSVFVVPIDIEYIFHQSLSVVVPSDGRERREEPAVAQLCLVDVSNWMIFKLLLIIYNKLLTAVVVAASEHI